MIESDCTATYAEPWHGTAHWSKETRRTRRETVPACQVRGVRPVWPRPEGTPILPRRKLPYAPHIKAEQKKLATAVRADPDRTFDSAGVDPQNVSSRPQSHETDSLHDKNSPCEKHWRNQPCGQSSIKIIIPLSVGSGAPPGLKVNSNKDDRNHAGVNAPPMKPSSTRIGRCFYDHAYNGARRKGGSSRRE